MSSRKSCRRLCNLTKTDGDEDRVFWATNLLRKHIQNLFIGFAEILVEYAQILLPNGKAM
jgi:hypothetical protein